MMTRSWAMPVLIAAIAASLIAAVGATMTDTGPWYDSLIQPRWAPPEAAYGIAWTVIYAITGLAAVTAWIALDSRREMEALVGLYALNGFLNILWSLLFFRMHRPDLAQVEVIALWCSVLALMIFTFRRSVTATLLLIPYLCWVTFAGYLNLTIVRLNGPFG